MYFAVFIAFILFSSTNLYTSQELGDVPSYQSSIQDVPHPLRPLFLAYTFQRGFPLIARYADIKEQDIAPHDDEGLFLSPDYFTDNGLAALFQRTSFVESREVFDGTLRLIALATPAGAFRCMAPISHRGFSGGEKLARALRKILIPANNGLIPLSPPEQGELWVPVENIRGLYTASYNFSHCALVYEHEHPTIITRGKPRDYESALGLQDAWRDHKNAQSRFIGPFHQEYLNNLEEILRSIEGT